MGWFNANEHILNDYSSMPQILKIVRRGIFIDTSPLFLLICGNFDKNNGTKFVENFDCPEIKKANSRKYTLRDYDSLLAFLNSLDLSTTPLFITQQVFTEFVQHLWKVCDNASTFKLILESSFKNKIHLKDTALAIKGVDFILNEDFLKKELEVGDISIIISAGIESQQKRARTILTGDKQFAIMSDSKYNFDTIYLEDIRNATLLLGKPIPPSLLRES